MEAGLLTEGTSNGGDGITTTSSSNNNQRSQPKYGRRSNVIAYGSSYQKAAALVDLVCLYIINLYIFHEFLAFYFSSSKLEFKPVKNLKNTYFSLINFGFTHFFFWFVRLSYVLS